MKLRGSLAVILMLVGYGPVSVATAASWSQPNRIIAAGAYHSCSTLTGTLRCWGSNSAGELGNGTTKGSLVPVTVSGLPTPVLEVGASYDRTCALVATATSGNKVYCWGRVATLDSNTLQPKSSAKPVKVSGIPATAHGLSVGVTHSCVLDSSGLSYCWGVNDRGQLGDGTTKNRAKAAKTKAAPATMLAASDGYTCALLTGGGVSCWGRSHGTAGDSLNPEGLVVNSKTPKTIIGLSSATTVSATGDFACALLSSSNVACWGENDHGQLGDGTVIGRSTPIVVAGTTGTADVSAGANHVCALQQNGSALGWGRNDYGEVGDGTFVDKHTPVSIVGLPSASNIVAASSGHYCFAEAQDGRVFAWGRDQYGQLGDGATVDRSLPVTTSVL